MSQNINFYETKEVKKHLPKDKDLQLEHTGIAINSRMLLAGASGTGKSNALMNYILKTSEPKNGTFKHIFLCCKILNEPLYEYLKEQLEDDITIFKSVAEFPQASVFPDQADKKKKDYYLLIFDDCVNDKSKEDVKKINEFFAYGRKKNCTILYLSQSYFMTPKFIRENIGYVILTSISSNKDLKRITAEYSFGDIDSHDIAELFNIATRKNNPSDLPFFKINLNNVSNNKKFSRNFTDYLDV